MPWKIAIPDTPEIIAITYSGVLKPEELMDAFRETVNQVTLTGRTRLLADCSQLVGGHGLVDLYRLAEALLSTGYAHKIREAILLPGLPGTLESVKFWETTCLNRGIQVRIFEHHKEATDWLTA